MSNPALQAIGLSKKYRIGKLLGRYVPEPEVEAAVSGRAGEELGTPRGTSRDFWALRDVTFDVKYGEVLGVIGSNGAGKSTLLKILSRITKPTHGRAIVDGRVSSLLEVGTGFHPELTGRDNVYLNGTILGMTHKEIDEKFDEIVTFAGVQTFIDTPVKRYSSGMKVRLGFAVAAHLESNILLVDEVLAVGDADFQRKCLDKMESIGNQGRAIMFVSHNMSAIAALCNRCVLLDRGRVAADGETLSVIGQYLSHEQLFGNENLAQRLDRKGSGAVRITGVDVSGGSGTVAHEMATGDDMRIIVKLSAATTPLSNVAARIEIKNVAGERVAVLASELNGEPLANIDNGRSLTCFIPSLPLNAGYYTCNASVTVAGQVADTLKDAFTFSVKPGDFFGSGKTATLHDGQVPVRHHWGVS